MLDEGGITVFRENRGGFPGGVQFRWGMRLFSLYNGEMPGSRNNAFRRRLRSGEEKKTGEF